MARGKQTTQSAVVTDPAEVRDRLDTATFTTVMALPTPAHLAAGVGLARLAEPMVRIRVLDGSNAIPAGPSGFVVGTHPSIPAVEVALEPGDPLEAVSRIGVPTDLASLASQAVADAEGDGPGIVATVDELDRAIPTSLRWYGPLSGAAPEAVRKRLEAGAFPTTARQLPADESNARRLASWLATLSLEADDRPPSAATALERLVSPTYTAEGPAPTVEGAHDILGLLSLGDPGLAIAACYDDSHWEAARTRYRELAEAVHDEVTALPVDRDGPLATATVESALLEPSAWLWTAFRLDHEYGLLVQASTQTRLALASSGNRSASALLEAVATATDGVHWGDEHVAGARIDASADELLERITDQL